MFILSGIAWSFATQNYFFQKGSLIFNWKVGFWIHAFLKINKYKCKAFFPILQIILGLLLRLILDATLLFFPLLFLIIILIFPISIQPIEILKDPMLTKVSKVTQVLARLAAVDSTPQWPQTVHIQAWARHGSIRRNKTRAVIDREDSLSALTAMTKTKATTTITIMNRSTRIWIR